MDEKKITENKVGKVMGEFGGGHLKSSSGETVTDPKQAQAIAFSEARAKLRRMRGEKQ